LILRSNGCVHGPASAITPPRKPARFSAHARRSRRSAVPGLGWSAAAGPGRRFRWTTVTPARSFRVALDRHSGSPSWLVAGTGRAAHQLSGIDRGCISVHFRQRGNGASVTRSQPRRLLARTAGGSAGAAAWRTLRSSTATPRVGVIAPSAQRVRRSRRPVLRGPWRRSAQDLDQGAVARASRGPLRRAPTMLPVTG